MKKYLMVIMGVLFASVSLAQEAPDPASVINDQQFQVGVFEWERRSDNQTEQFFYYNGVITEKSSDVLMDAIEQFPDVKKIAFNSSGGQASEAAELGAILSDNDIQSWVPSGRFCLSACANAFIGGRDYIISGVLGFHAAWVPHDSIDSLNATQLNQLFQGGQFAGVQDVYYWMVNGFSIQLPASINSATSPEKFLVFRSADELLEYYVRNDEDTEAESKDQLRRYLTWNSEIKPTLWTGVEMVPYLQEQQEEIRENGREVRYIASIYDPVAEKNANEEK